MGGAYTCSITSGSDGLCTCRSVTSFPGAAQPCKRSPFAVGCQPREPAVGPGYNALEITVNHVIAYQENDMQLLSVAQDDLQNLEEHKRNIKHGSRIQSGMRSLEGFSAMSMLGRGRVCMYPFMEPPWIAGDPDSRGSKRMRSLLSGG